MDRSLSGSSVQGILQSTMLEWVAVPSCRGSSRPRNQTHVSCIFCIGRWVFLPLAPPGKPRHLRLLDKLTKHPLSGKCCGEDFLPTMECGLNPDVLEFSCVDLDEFGGEPRPFFQGVFPMSFFFSPTKPSPILLKMAPLSLNVLEHSVSHFV